MCSLHFSLDYEYYEYDFASCMTIGGPQPNKPCVFPFNFNEELLTVASLGRDQILGAQSKKIMKGVNGDFVILIA